MVQFPSPGKLRPESVPPSKVAAVKLEIEDPLDEEHGPVNKRYKCAAPFHQWGAGAGMAPSQGIQYNLLDEPSPLGLRLRKSPSFLDLIQMRLSQANSEAGEKEIKSSATNDKLKASNFPVSLLRIGSWECVSKYDGDLVAKCYYAKHKLVWEVLDGGLKSKIEIQWSDIIALKATCPEDGPGTLDIVLGRPPLFFRETNPQPRKHTLWQATSDFTGGQASIDRRHFIQCSPGLLNKHFEKLIQCDPHLNSLSQHPEVILESPYFGTRCSVFEVQAESKCHDSDNPNENNGPCFSGLHNPGSPCAAAAASTKSKVMKPASMELDILPQGTPPSSGNANSSRWDRLKVPALRGSMSMIDLANHIGQYCISEQMTSGDPLSDDGLPDKDVLEELAQYLLSDSQAGPTSASDEQSLMSRVDSLCCLLQRDASAVQKPEASSGEGTLRCDAGRDDRPKPEPEASADDEQPAGMSRIESFGELLMHLPRIASMPQFLFDI